MAKSLKQLQQNSHIVRINDLNVNYWESGAHLKPTIVMLHGFRSSHEGLMKLAQEFPDHHLIIPDFPGYGETDELTDKHTVGAYAKFVAAFIHHLDLDNVTLLGHSFGALIALTYAAEHPGHVLNLVLISPVPKPTIVSRAGTLYYRIGGALPAPLNRHWLTNRTLHRPVRSLIVRADDPILRAEVMSEGEKELDVLKPHINVQNYLSLASIDPTPWIDKIETPILVITGDADPLTHLSDVTRTYDRPGVTFEIIHGMGHFAPAEIPARIAETARTWLQAKDGRNPSA